jgi:glutamate-1-semialdehyde 2,1-aminomutase
MMRRALIERGIYFFPLAVKQGSISAAHTAADIEATLVCWREVLTTLDTDSPHTVPYIPASSRH